MLRGTHDSSRCNWNDMSKNTLYGLGSHEFRRSGDVFMNARQEYLLKAAELSAMAQVETDQADKLEFENLARSYKQAERNGTADLACKTPSKTSRLAKMEAQSRQSLPCPPRCSVALGGCSGLGCDEKCDYRA